MSILIKFISCAILFCPAESISQDYLKLLKDASYGEFARHLDNEVEFEVNRNKQILAKQEALRKLRQELATFKPVDWEMMHSGQSERNAENYVILKTSNANGDVLRIFLHTRGKTSAAKITAIRFRKAL